MLDADACECCWNAILAPGDGAAYALYRGKNPRDMAVAVSRDGGANWGKPAAAGAFGWGFNGCPHVGGALAAGAGGVSALAWTGKEGAEGLYVYSSPDGKTWTRAARLGGTGAKHADMTASRAAFAAAWDESGRVWAATSPDGKTWTSPAAVSAPGVEATHPRVAAAGKNFRVFWTEKGRYADAELLSSR